MLDTTEELYGQRYFLFGSFIDVPPIVSTFATPVFYIRGDNSRQVYIQKIDPSGFVSVFLPVTLEDETGLLPIEGLDLEMREGDAALYSFLGPRKGVITYGNQAQMRRFLRAHLDALSANRFTHFEVLQFLGLIDQAKLLFPDEVSREEATRFEELEARLHLQSWVKIAVFALESSAIMGIHPIIECRLEISGPLVDDLSIRLKSETILAMEKIGTSYNSLGPYRSIDLKTVRRLDTEMTEVRFVVKSASEEFSVRGTVFSDGVPRIMEIGKVSISFRLAENMLLLWGDNLPGIFGLAGMTLGKNGVNISDCSAGQVVSGSSGILSFSFDAPIPERIATDLQNTGMFANVLDGRFRFLA